MRVLGLLPNMDSQEAYEFAVTADQIAEYADDGEYEMSEGWAWKLNLRDLMYVCERAHCPAGKHQTTDGMWSMSFDNWG